MKKNKKLIIIGVIIISIVLIVAGILLWYFAGEDKEKQSTEPHKVPMTQEGVFPYQIPNTSLVIQKVRSYDGVFIEDGSDKTVSGISAIVVENVGDEYIEYAGTAKFDSYRKEQTQFLNNVLDTLIFFTSHFLPLKVQLVILRSIGYVNVILSKCI